MRKHILYTVFEPGTMGIRYRFSIFGIMIPYTFKKNKPLEENRITQEYAEHITKILIR